jgi:hypothetical protein
VVSAGQPGKTAVAAPEAPADQAQAIRATTVELGTEEVVQRFAPAVATIRGKLGSGSGFLVAPNILATNHHVIGIEFINQLAVHFPSAPPDKRGPYGVSLLAEDARRDLAFLRLSCPLPHLSTSSGPARRSS